MLAQVLDVDGTVQTYLAAAILLSAAADGQVIAQELAAHAIEREAALVELDLAAGAIDGRQFRQQVDVIVGEVEGPLCAGINGMVQRHLELQVQTRLAGGGAVFHDVAGPARYRALVDVLQEGRHGAIGNAIDFQHGIM